MEKMEKHSDIASTLVISILFSTVAIIGSTYYFVNKQSDQLVNKVVTKIETIEAEKVWWEANYKMLKKLYSNKTFAEQQGSQIKSALDQFGASDSSAWSWSNSSESADWEFKKWTLTQENFDRIMDWAYVKWNKDAKILWLEYSDLECPFCKRHHVQGTVKTVMDKYEGKMKYIFRHYPLPFHEYAQKASEALECVGELWWEEKFFEFEDKWFAADALDVSTLLWIAKWLWLSEKKVKDCIESWKYKDKTQAQMKEWTEIFNITGTPWNVMINLETMEYVIVPWAYPAETFDWIVSKWIK